MHMGDPTAPEDDRPVQTCVYCANLTVLREVLPPKRCNYCRKWRCQFCTLKFPLLGVRKGLPKALKGNSRICVQCFGKVWQENETDAPDLHRRLRGDTQVSPPEDQERRRESRGVSFVDQNSMTGGRRGSMFDSELGSSRRSSLKGSSRRRGSMFDSERRESMMVDRVWAGVESFGDDNRPSFLDNSDNGDFAKRVAVPTPRADGLSYRTASFLGLVPTDGLSGPNITSAIDLWISLFAASVLMVIALADGFSLQQRVCYCVVTYGVFLTLHPWIHANRKDEVTPWREHGAEPPRRLSAATPQLARAVKLSSRKSAASSGNEPVPAAYKSRLQEMEKTMAYYLSDESPWKLVKATRGIEIYEMTANNTPFPIFKIEAVVPGISVADFMDYLDRTDPRDRSVWDLNEANFEVIETFDGSDINKDAEVSVCVNTQKPFLGGLVAPRDFCLLYLSEEDSICFSSVEHPKVPMRPGTTRGDIFFSCLHCKEDPSIEDGFLLTYICQTDIGGALPVKLLYNGTMDNMEKMTKVFQQAKTLFRR
ncbi:hypothetical protein PHYBOEH_001912 [Phytophthora boehmeriae]|uniref:START domain-containing protein n=1 Tax=Phytophthora boehmeriae TaxID=109152 RepID=A0A8T1WY20_9STRA|nr:hypothetical protein PHYBOEH_001912 [Phytophthora boehmeriae]